MQKFLEIHACFFTICMFHKVLRNLSTQENPESETSWHWSVHPCVRKWASDGFQNSCSRIQSQTLSQCVRPSLKEGFQDRFMNEVGCLFLPVWANEARKKQSKIPRDFLPRSIKSISLPTVKLQRDSNLAHTPACWLQLTQKPEAGWIINTGCHSIRVNPSLLPVLI